MYLNSSLYRKNRVHSGSVTIPAIVNIKFHYYIRLFFATISIVKINSYPHRLNTKMSCKLNCNHLLFSIINFTSLFYLFD